MQRLTSLVYHRAFPLELLFGEFVAILFLGSQAAVKKVKTKTVVFAQTALVNFRDKINFHLFFRT